MPFKHGVVNLVVLLTSIPFIGSFHSPAPSHQRFGSLRPPLLLHSSLSPPPDLLSSLPTEQQEMVAAMRNPDLSARDFAEESTTMLLTTDKGWELPLVYDAAYLGQFFDKKPLAVAKRVAQIATGLAPVLSGALSNLLTGKSGAEADKVTAGALRDSLTSLGPFFIKLGQAMSIRPDIISPTSMRELQRLCDKVPSFPSAEAFAILEAELGKPVGDVFEDISPEPIAAASLGQVYKATVRGTGEEVAVKIQRPGVLETVSLDLFIFRKFGSIFKGGLNVVALLDEFAFRFMEELDYEKECANGIAIKKQMSNLPNIKIPGCFPALTTRRVHTAEWCEGEKLSQSNANDITELVNLGVLAYLSMLLNHGNFHADPHPGNMLRSPEGELIILDFGLMTQVSESARFGMVDAIVHLVNRDYKEIGQDFINLEFIPEGTDVRPIVPALTKVFDAALAGGGAKSINFQELAADLAEITFAYDFRLPPYFALIIRAISVLEGIALVGNPKFAIIDESYPFISRLLLTSPSPRLKQSLKYLVYPDGVFDADRMIDVLVAFEKYNSVEKGDGTAFKVDGVRGGVDLGDADGSKAGTKKVVVAAPNPSPSSFGDGSDGGRLGFSSSSSSPAPPQTPGSARDALKFFFSPDGVVFREFLLDEICNSVDAVSRNVIFELGKQFGLDAASLPTFRGFNLIPGVGLLASLSPPLTPKDKENLAQIGKLLSFLRGYSAGGEGGGSNTELARQIFPIVREYREETRAFLIQVVLRLTEQRIGRGLNYLEGRVRSGVGGSATPVTSVA